MPCNNVVSHHIFSVMLFVLSPSVNVLAFKLPSLLFFLRVFAGRCCAVHSRCFSTGYQRATNTPGWVMATTAFSPGIPCGWYVQCLWMFDCRPLRFFYQLGLSLGVVLLILGCSRQRLFLPFLWFCRSPPLFPAFPRRFTQLSPHFCVAELCFLVCVLCAAPFLAFGVVDDIVVSSRTPCEAMRATGARCGGDRVAGSGGSIKARRAKRGDTRHRTGGRAGAGWWWSMAMCVGQDRSKTTWGGRRDGQQRVRVALKRLYVHVRVILS